jgi:hypothetical protein
MQQRPQLKQIQKTKAHSESESTSSESFPFLTLAFFSA